MPDATNRSWCSARLVIVTLHWLTRLRSAVTYTLTRVCTRPARKAFADTICALA